MIKEFSNAGYKLTLTISVVRQGNPFTVPAADLQELIRFLIEKCGMTPEEVCQILQEQLSIPLAVASQAVNAAQLAMEHDNAPPEEDEAPEGP